MINDIRDTIEVNGSIVEHIPVLAETLAEQIKLPPDGVMVDATIGQGGHSYLFGKTLGPEGVIVGLDVDTNAIRRAQFLLKDLSCKVILLHSNFSRISEQVQEQGIDKVDFIFADLGLCSAQLADSRMGLSFLHDMPLDMRIDKRLKRTAADIVNKANEKSLADLIYKFGEDRASRRIARFIVRERESGPITTTVQLARIVCKALGKAGRSRKSKIHPATRTFQALRIAVNDELENLKRLLASAPELLNDNGYIAVISYHSLEDRLVKNDFKQNGKDSIYRVITKKPIVATRQEIAENRRARSAKLRIAQKQ
ncbi:MAG: 16S rRNA (cytosine(1402)-N(4))-methyltransferase RsmH [Planctomycetes bacterium]|nr:16S rRNA (cytosine(1402)-N(4))-methyltransferase RsmH [Planctomycetota bacterium]MCH8119076.1 16S rRNA (cytosine(1402)-N(4))-methyltransferase RsmH [Planctomycetota bacterium]